MNSIVLLSTNLIINHLTSPFQVIGDNKVGAFVEQDQIINIENYGRKKDKKIRFIYSETNWGIMKTNFLLIQKILPAPQISNTNKPTGTNLIDPAEKRRMEKLQRLNNRTNATSNISTNK